MAEKILDENILRVAPVEVNVEPDQFLDPIIPAYDPSTEQEAPTSGEVWNAAFQLHNVPVNIYNYFTREEFEPQEGFDFSQVNLQGYEAYADRFYYARSEDEVGDIKHRINNEIKYRQILNDAHGAESFVASAAAGLVDPLTFVPIAGAMAKAKTGAQAIAIASGGSAAIAGTAEVGLHLAQETRTAGESLMVVGMSSMIGGVLGRAGYALTRKQIDAIATDLVDRLRWGDMTPEQKLAVAEEMKVNPELAARIAELRKQNMIAGDAKLSGRGDAGVHEELMQLLTDTAKRLDPSISEGAEIMARGLVGADTAGRGGSAGARDSQVAASEAAPGARPALIEEGAAQPPKDWSAKPTTLEDEGLYREGAMKVASRAAILQTDTMKLATSPSYWTRVLNQMVAEDNFLRNKNVFKGIARSESVEVRLKIEGDQIAYVGDELRSGWRAYVNRVPADQREFKNYREWSSAATRAALLGDDISVAARGIGELGGSVRAIRKYLDRYDAMGRRLGVFGEGTTRGGIKTLTHSFNTNKIMDSRAEFVSEMVTELRRLSGQDIAPDGRAWQDLATDAHDRIVGLRGQTNSIMDPSVTKAFKDAGVDIDFSDSFVRNWMNTDAEDLLSKYHRRTVSELVLAETLAEKGLWKGNLKSSIDAMYDGIRFDYKEMMAKATNKEANKLAKQQTEDIQTLQRIIERLTGTMHRPIGSQSAAAAKEIARMSSLGGVLLSSIPDMARLITIDGISGVVRALPRFMKDVDNMIRKLPRDELQRLAAPNEMRSQTVIRAVGGTSDDLMPTGAFGSALESTGRAFSMATGLPAWNQLIKQMAGEITLNRINRLSAQAIKGGKMSASEARYLAQLGIDADAMNRIGKEWRLHAKGSSEPNLDVWTDRDAARRVHYAIRKNVDNVVVTPHAGGLPHFFDNPLGGVLFQFKSFLFAFWNQGVMAGMQQGDLHFLTSLVAAVALGGITVKARQAINGTPGADNFNEFLRQSFDASGLGGITWDAVLLTEDTQRRAFGGTSAPDFLFGTDAPTHKYVGRGTGEKFLGPVPNLFANFGLKAMPDLVASATGNGDFFNRADVNSVRKIVPFQNLFYMRRLFDDLENKIGDHFDLSGRSKPGLLTAEGELLETFNEGDITEVQPFLSRN